MRIVSGTLGGRNFDAPKGHKTHPMSEKIRGAIFNMLGDVSGLTVLDAFTGSGALAFEVISRGAEHVTAVDIDKGAITTVYQSVNALNLDKNITPVNANVRGWSKRHPKQTFNLIFCDPPFNHVQHDTVELLQQHLAPKGIFVINWPVIQDLPRLPDLELLSHKTYGTDQLLMFRKP